MTQELKRYQWVDALRGVAIVLMIAYHFCYDLSYFRLADFDFYRNPFWLSARIVIVSLFLFLVGVSLQLAARRGLATPHFWRAFGRRLAWLLLCAGLVSLASYIIFPSRWIFFGILHFISVASVLGLCFINAPLLGLMLGCLLIVVGNLFAAPLFDQPLLQWVGLMTHKPATEDYVPLIPWFGVVLIGNYFGHLWFARRHSGPELRLSFAAPAVAALAAMGRYGLHIYMLHQPIMLGALALLTTL